MPSHDRQFEFIAADLSLMSTVVSVAQQYAAAHPAGVDYLLLTVGVIASVEPRFTSEGLEFDLATSALSRLAFLNALKSYLLTNKDTYVGVWAFPGVFKPNQTHPIEQINVKEHYGIASSHGDTIVINEAVGYHLWKKYSDKLRVAQFNPGMLATDIRNDFYDSIPYGLGRVLSAVFESLFAWSAPSVEWYADVTIRVILNSAVDYRSQAVVVNQKGHFVQPSNFILQNDFYVKLYQKATELLSFVPLKDKF